MAVATHTHHITHTMPDTEIYPLELTIEFKDIELGQLAKFFLGLRSVALSSLILHLQANNSHRESLRRLGKSYFAFLSRDGRTHRWLTSDCFNIDRLHPQEPFFPIASRLLKFPDELFDLPFVADTFDDWADSVLSTHDIIVESVREGSLVAVLGMAILLDLADVPYNYSIMKDVVLLMTSRIQAAVRGKNPVSGTLQHIPTSVVDLAKHPRVKRLRYKWSDQSGTLEVEKF